MPAADWTEDHVALLRARYDAGDSSAKIARYIHQETGARFSREAVTGKRIRLGLRRMPIFRMQAWKEQGRRSGVARSSEAPLPPKVKMPPARAPGPVARGLLDVGKGCKFPVGEAYGFEQLFCGEVRADDTKPYCLKCSVIAYRPRDKVEA